jgi:hypothetical protein
MPGPAPKDPSTRARRNRTSTHAQLKADPSIEAPALPERVWQPMTVAWWADVWASPMAPEFDGSDKHGLFALAVLVDDFWSADDARARRDLAAEIRQQSQRFGLSPIDRRRLQWEIERSEEAQERGSRRRTRDAEAASSRSESSDPRAVLRAL